MKQPMQPLLEVSHLTMRFGGVVAIDDFSMTVRPHEITSVIGPNGAGKTTLFSCLTGFYRPTAGSVTLQHPEHGAMRLESMPSHEVTRAGRIVRTFQTSACFRR